MDISSVKSKYENQLLQLAHVVGVAKEDLSNYDLIPTKLGDMQTDVLAVGYPLAGGGVPLEAYILLHWKSSQLSPGYNGYSGILHDSRIQLANLLV